MTDLIEHVASFAKDGMGRAPVVIILALEIAAFAWLGHEILNEAASERRELRADKADLTEQLIRCHQLHAASVSVQSDDSP